METKGAFPPDAILPAEIPAVEAGTSDLAAKIRQEFVYRLPGSLSSELTNCFIENSFREHAVNLKPFLEGIEKSLIIDILNKVNGCQRSAAKVLGVKPTTLNQKIKKHRIRIIQKSVTLSR